MEEPEKNTSFREEFEAHLNSPLPLLMRLRNFIFGKQKPDFYTQFSFFFAFIIWFIFILWSIMGAIVIKSRFWIEQEKGIAVNELINKRGVELGFAQETFIDRLQLFYVIAFICWVVVFVGLILLWRKNRKFVYLFFPACGVYLLFMFTMLGFGYWANDTTLFDKITFFLLIGNTALYAYFLMKEKSEKSSDFFSLGETE